LREKAEAEQAEHKESRKNERDLVLEDDDTIVPDELLGILGKSEKLRPFLSHSKLREVIKRIDGSRNRQEALEI